MSNKITTNIYPIYPFNASLLMDVFIIFFVKINKQGKVLLIQVYSVTYVYKIISKIFLCFLNWLWSFVKIIKIDIDIQYLQLSGGIASI